MSHFHGAIVIDEILEVLRLDACKRADGGDDEADQVESPSCGITLKVAMQPPPQTFSAKLIVGQRKESTDEKTSLNDALRVFEVPV